MRTRPYGSEAGLTDGASVQTYFLHDGLGLPARRHGSVTHLPNGVDTGYAYDTAGRLESVVNIGPGPATISSFDYTLDAVGNRTEMEDLDGTHSYQYDALYRLTGVTYPDEETDAYTYDPVGNRLTKDTDDYTYDDADQLTDLEGTSFGYDDNGNQTSRGNDTFTYDHENRLVESVIDSVTSTSEYNGDGLRMSHTVDQTTTNYIWDVVAGLPVVLQDGTNTYVYGLDLISATDGAGVQTYHLYDGLGSTTDLTDHEGDAVDGYTYDVFGAIRSQSGSSDNPWLFTGEQRDADSDMYYLRARYYDPAIGRFLSQDPLRGSLDTSQTQNRYLYVTNNPALLIDPYGLCGVLDPGDCISDALECLENGGDCITEPVEDTASDLSDAVASGYVDVNATAVLPWPWRWGGVAITGGAQLSFRDGFQLHPYGGAGMGSPPGWSLSVTSGPAQPVTTGLSCGAQGSYITPLGVGPTGQIGVSGIFRDKEGNAFFWEVGVAGSRRPGISGALTCYYILPDVWPW